MVVIVIVLVLGPLLGPEAVSMRRSSNLRISACRDALSKLCAASSAPCRSNHGNGA